MILTVYVPAFVALRLPETTLKSLFKVSVLPLTTIVVVWLFALYVSDFAVADLTFTLVGDDVAANATVGTIIAIHTTIAKSFFKFFTINSSFQKSSIVLNI